MTERQYLDAAKAQLRAKLREHEDEGVRLLAETVNLPDDDPRVQVIARGIQIVAGGYRG